MDTELITIGSCTLDTIIQIEDILRFELLEKDFVKKYTAIEYSRKLNIENVEFHPGGSAANIASNSAMLGLNSMYLGILGDDFSARICMDDMKERGVDLSNVELTEKDKTAFSVILRTDWGKDRSILAYKGANNLITPEKVKEEYFDDIKAFAWTSLTKENACKSIDKAITFTKERDGTVYAAPSMSIIKNNPKWAKILISNSDVISLNKEEASEFTKETETMHILDKFFDLGLDLVSITDGAKGSIVSDGETVVNSSIYDVKVEDTTGSGDAFLSGILFSRMEGFSLQKTCKIASAMSALECKQTGVRIGVPSSIQELEKFIDANELKQITSKIQR
jgi:sugar/nucleoside kinase (ribokinase family)